MEITRREFLKMTSAAAAETAIRMSLPLDRIYPVRPRFRLPFQEIIDQFPSVNPHLGAVNFSCVPDSVNGQWQGLHHPQEALAMTVPFQNVEAGKLDLGIYTEGFKDAIKTSSGIIYSVVETIEKPADYESAEWEKGIEPIAQELKGISLLGVGNEMNASYSPWRRSLATYAELFQRTAEKIKRVSSETKICPWQEAYVGQGEALKEFLEIDDGKVRPFVDGLAVNFYDLPGQMAGFVQSRRKILDEQGLNDRPIFISEMGVPINYSYSPEQQADLVIQDLAQAASLIQKGKIIMAFWYCAYGPDQKQSLSNASSLGGFRAKPGLFAFEATRRILEGTIILNRDDSGLVETTVTQAGWPKAKIVWNEGEKQQTINPPPGIRRAWKATGEILSAQNEFSLQPSLKPDSHPGETAILVY